MDEEATMITVTPIPHEHGRFHASSRSRPGLLHIVDVAFQENPGDKPKAVCSCEDSFAKGNICAHIGAVVQYLCNHQTHSDS